MYNPYRNSHRSKTLAPITPSINTRTLHEPAGRQENRLIEVPSEEQTDGMPVPCEKEQPYKTTRLMHTQVAVKQERNKFRSSFG